MTHPSFMYIQMICIYIIHQALEEEEPDPDIGDIYFDADQHRPKRSYPTSVTPYTAPPYAAPVVFETPSGLSDADEEEPDEEPDEELEERATGAESS
jgi:hypothetical protein